MEKLIVDRVTDGFVVLEKEDRTNIQVSVEEIGFQVKEGNVLNFDGEKYSSDISEEVARRKRIFEMQQKLKNR